MGSKGGFGSMGTEVSALADGELNAHEVADIVASLRQDVELRVAWNDYQMIGAALRRETRLSQELTARVMTGLSLEPVVLSPQPRLQSKQAVAWQRSLMTLTTMAASAAGVAVVAWMAFSSQMVNRSPASSELAQAPVGAANLAEAAIKPGAREDMREYLIAHQAHAPISQMPGGTQNIRLVSVSGGLDRR